MDRFSPVLLVSSSERVLSRFNDELGSHGVTVLSARDIETALSILETRNPVIALVSITVNTNEDGLETARALRARSSIPIAFLARGAVSPSVGTRLSMVPHDGIIPDDIDVSFIRELIRNAPAVRGETVAPSGEVTSDSEWRAQLIEGILHLSPSAVVVLDENHHIVDWNPAATRLFGYDRGEVVGRQIDGLIVDEHDADRRREAEAFTRQALSQIAVEPTETIRYRKDGSTVDVIVAGEPIHVGGRFRGVVAYYHDIGPVVAARRRVEELLAEKEILLGEIQHRVKNDIALIESMLSLQASRYESPAMQEAMNDAINRIASVRSVYDALHRFRGIDRVGTRPLIENLIANHRDVLTERDIALETAIDEIVLPTGAAISVGLVVNELLTNVVKYAFPADHVFSEMRVIIGLNTESGEGLSLHVRDTGVGPPVDGPVTGYGLTFVRAIAEQYRGDVQIDGERGTSVHVFMRVPPSSEGSSGV